MAIQAAEIVDELLVYTGQDERRRAPLTSRAGERDVRPCLAVCIGKSVRLTSDLPTTVHL